MIFTLLTSLPLVSARRVPEWEANGARPLSASELSEVFDGNPSKGAFAYHLNTLAAFGALTQVGTEQVRGGWKRLFVISSLVET